MELNVFPIELKKHIFFCVVASIFFLLQFIRTKHWYQLVMAAAVPLSLLIYIDPDNNYIFYGVGVLEGVLLLLALVLNIIQSKKEEKAEKLKKAAAADAPAVHTEE